MILLLDEYQLVCTYTDLDNAKAH